MGAAYQDVSFGVMSVADMQKRFSAYQADQSAEFGYDSYGGHIGLAQGVRVIDKTFATMNEASDWVTDNHNKYDPAIAVKVGDFSKAFRNKPAVAKLVASISELSNEVNSFNTDILKRAKAAKSTMRGCKHCDSRINMSKYTPDPKNQLRYVTDCPVCGKNLLVTDTDSARLVRLQEKLKDLQGKLAEMEKGVDKKKEPKWYIGAWCPC